MVQQGFGRRTSSPRAAAETAARPTRVTGSSTTTADAPSSAAARSAAGRSAAILAGVMALVVAAALGLTFAFNAVAKTDSEDTVAEEARCRSQSGCTNRYEVALGCGSSEEPRSVSVLAADAEAAQAKAERYNRDCRARGASFVAIFTKSGARSAVASRVAEAAPRTADSSATRRRGRWRLRRR